MLSDYYPRTINYCPIVRAAGNNTEKLNGCWRLYKGYYYCTCRLARNTLQSNSNLYFYYILMRILIFWTIDNRISYNTELNLLWTVNQFLFLKKKKHMEFYRNESSGSECYSHTRPSDWSMDRRAVWPTENVIAVRGCFECVASSALEQFYASGGAAREQSETVKWNNRYYALGVSPYSARAIGKFIKHCNSLVCLVERSRKMIERG